MRLMASKNEAKQIVAVVSEYVEDMTGKVASNKTADEMFRNGVQRVAAQVDMEFSEEEGPRIAGLKSRRAMYWCAPDRTYRLTQQEQDSGSALCPKCKVPMGKEPFTRSEKLIVCPQCRFKVPTSKAVTKVEVKVPEGVSVQVTQTDSNGDDVQGETVMAGRRMKNASMILAEVVDPSELARLPQMKLDEIAYMVMKDWKNVYFGAKPYLEAMSTLRDIKEDYGMDSGSSIVAYFLANSQSWRGEVAKAIKKELNGRLKRAR